MVHRDCSVLTELPSRRGVRATTCKPFLRPLFTLVPHPSQVTCAGSHRLDFHTAATSPNQEVTDVGTATRVSLLPEETAEGEARSGVLPGEARPNTTAPGGS